MRRTQLLFALGVSTAVLAVLGGVAAASPGRTTSLHPKTIHAEKFGLTFTYPSVAVVSYQQNEANSYLAPGGRIFAADTWWKKERGHMRVTGSHTGEDENGFGVKAYRVDAPQPSLEEFMNEQPGYWPPNICQHQNYGVPRQTKLRIDGILGDQEECIERYRSAGVSGQIIVRVASIRYRGWIYEFSGFVSGLYGIPFQWREFLRSVHVKR